MEEFLPTKLLDLLAISIVYSSVLMTLIQKFKSLPFVKKSWHIWVLNLIFSFSIGMPFSLNFYNIDLKNSIWVGFFSFIGASAIYEALKKQTILKYKPTSISDNIILSKDKEIKR